MRLKLKFCGTITPELCESHFAHPLLARTLSSTRGKAGGAFPSYGTFQWTKAVKAVSILAIRAKLSVLEAAQNMAPFIQGEAGTLAASLDYAIQKEPAWVLDLFGVDASGSALIRRVFHRSNPGRKRVGPVAISWNPMFIPHKEIEIWWEEKNINSAETLQYLLEKLEPEMLSSLNAKTDDDESELAA